MYRLQSRDRRAAFTVIEIVVTVAIVGVLLALLLPAVQRVRETANRTACANNLRQLAAAIHSYESMNRALVSGSVGPVNTDGTFPTGWYNPVFGDKSPWGHFGWPALLLSHLDHDPLFRQITFDVPAYAESIPVNSAVDVGPAGNDTNKTPSSSMPPVFICKSVLRVKPETQFKDYGINCGTGKFLPERTVSGLDGISWLNSRTRVTDIVDGTSATFLFLESSHAGGHGKIPPGVGTNQFFWVDHNSQGYVTSGEPDGTPSPPNSTTFSHRGAQGGHRNGVQTVMVDGRVVWIPNDVDYRVYRGMFSRAGREFHPSEY
jgi:type II secretory pathway pseudopilin PulG